MKVRELIDKLSEAEPDEEVVVRILDGPDAAAIKVIKSIAYGLNPNRIVLNTKQY